MYYRKLPVYFVFLVLIAVQSLANGGFTRTNDGIIVYPDTCRSGAEGGGLEKDLLRELYTNAGATTENYPPGVYVYWRDGFFIAVNYSSADYAMSLPAGAKIIIGGNLIKPAGVLVWKENN